MSEVCEDHPSYHRLNLAIETAIKRGKSLADFDKFMSECGIPFDSRKLRSLRKGGAVKMQFHYLLYIFDAFSIRASNVFPGPEDQDWTHRYLIETLGKILHEEGIDGQQELGRIIYEAVKHAQMLDEIEKQNGDEPIY